LGADVRVPLETEAAIPVGVDEQLQRIVSENCKTVKVEQHGFEVV
jgi:hypothetical protein